MCDGRRGSSSCAMGAGAAVVVRWPPEQQICREFIKAVVEGMDPDKLSAGSWSGGLGGAEELPEIKQRRAVYEPPSCKESVFSKMLAIETMSALRTLFAI